MRRIVNVTCAGAVSALPLADAVETGSTATIGEPPPIPGKAHPTEYLVTEGDYFRAMRISLPKSYWQLKAVSFRTSRSSEEDMSCRPLRETYRN